jgi:D-alanine-D-alanine ligase-like ATP-grasp enzyme
VKELRILVVHERLSGPLADHQEDTLYQAAKAADALRERGHQSRVCPLARFEDLSSVVRDYKPDVIFSLIESLLDFDELFPLGVEMIERLGIPFTGNDQRLCALTIDKLLVKAVLSAAGLRVPDWVSRRDLSADRETGSARRLRRLLGRRLLLKPSRGGGARFISRNSLVQAENLAELEGLVLDAEQRTGCEMFAEEYLEGREFKIGLIPGSGGEGTLVSAATEISFDQVPSDHPRIITEEIAWSRRGAPEVFFKAAADDAARLSQDAMRAVESALSLRPPSRIDVRVQRGAAYVTDVNANCSISDESSLYNSAELEGIPYPDFIERLVLHALGESRSRTPRRRIP